MRTDSPVNSVKTPDCSGEWLRLSWGVFGGGGLGVTIRAAAREKLKIYLLPPTSTTTTATATTTNKVPIRSSRRGWVSINLLACEWSAPASPHTTPSLPSSVYFCHVSRQCLARWPAKHNHTSPRPTPPWAARDAMPRLKLNSKLSLPRMRA